MAPEGEYESRDSFRALNENEVAEIETGLRDWAESHPSGKEPIFFEMGRSLTAMDFAIEVAERTDIGRVFLEYIAIQSERSGTRPRTFIDRAILANRGE